jgi:hypothetical protein
MRFNFTRVSFKADRSNRSKRAMHDASEHVETSVAESGPLDVGSSAAERLDVLFGGRV